MPIVLANFPPAKVVNGIPQAMRLPRRPDVRLNAERLRRAVVSRAGLDERRISCRPNPVAPGGIWEYTLDPLLPRIEPEDGLLWNRSARGSHAVCLVNDAVPLPHLLDRPQNRWVRPNPL